MFSTLAVMLCAASVGYGQEQNAAENLQIEDVPPPLVSLTKTEAQQLQAETDFKKRTQLCLILADSRLQRAETLTESADFHNALIELGAYRAIVANGIKFLQGSGSETKKMRDNMKRLEMTLRTHVPRIEGIRRLAPSEYAVHVKSVLNFARDTRSLALETFFDDTVIAETPRGGIKSTAAPAKDSNSSGFSPEKKPN